MRAIKCRSVVLILILALSFSVAECARAGTQATALGNQQSIQQGSQQSGQQGQQSGTTGTGSQSDSQDKSKDKPPETKKNPDPNQQPANTTGQQTNRILGVMPNYRAVSANTHLAPLSVKGKFVLATKDSCDYTSAIFVGLLAGVRQGLKQEPPFGGGMAAYGRYFWRSYADQAIGNYFSEAIMPSILREDPHYYTLARGGHLHRALHAFSRVLITQRDSGRTSFNFSEVIGNGFAAGIANLYYPAQDRNLRSTGINWGEQIISDGLANILKEFWPDIHDRIHRKKQSQP
ncbi:MAG: hypothetical protein WAM91_00820 [Candidatus Acidiferrales bacterium]